MRTGFLRSKSCPPVYRVSAFPASPFFTKGETLVAYLEDWIRNTTELEPTTKLFLHCLASYADAETGVCYPSQETLATAMSVSVRTVQRELRKCLELNLVAVRRRWRKSNVYKVLCLKRQDVSTMPSSDDGREQPPSLEKNVKNGSKNSARQRWVSPREISVLLSDIGEVMGERLLQQNRGFYIKIIRSATATYEIIQECLAHVRRSLLEAQCSEASVHNPSGLFWWKLREAGVSL